MARLVRLPRLVASYAWVAACAGLAGCGFPRPADVSGEFPEDGNTGGVVIRVAPTGDDTNDGVSQPVKTLRRGLALAAVTRGVTTVELAAGRYATASGERFPYTLTDGLTIAGGNGGVAVLAGSATEDALVVEAGGVQAIELEGFSLAIRAKGVVALEGVVASGNRLAVQAEAGAAVSATNLRIFGSVDMCGAGVLLTGDATFHATELTSRTLLNTLDAKDDASAEVSRADITGDPRCPGTAVRATTNRVVAMADSVITATAAGINAGKGEGSPGTTTVRLTNTSVKYTSGAGVIGGRLTFEMTGGEISSCGDGGVVATGSRLTLSNVKLQNNTGGYALYLQGASATVPGSLVMRGCTVASNEAGVSLFDWSAGDLGTDASPGNNVLLGNAGASLSVSGDEGPKLVNAVGNTWNADVQGADAAGRYPPPAATVQGPMNGGNLLIASGLGVRR